LDGNAEDDNFDPEDADLEELDAIEADQAQQVIVENQPQDGDEDEMPAEPPAPAPVQQQARFDGDPAYSPEFLASLKINGMPHGSLHLKKGVPIMLLCNLDPSNGLCNGTRLIVCNIHRRVLEAKIITGTHSGTNVLIPRITLYSKKEDIGFVLSHCQFPVCLAFISKSSCPEGYYRQLQATTGCHGTRLDPL
jgi:hypothetical protein